MLLKLVGKDIYYLHKKRKMKNIKLFVITIFCVTNLSCKQNNMNAQDENKDKNKTDFGWSSSVTSILDYPIEVHTGYLATKKEFITAFRNNGVEQNGWDVDGQEGGSGGRIIPTLVSLTWVSYAEKKFWLLDEAVLPADKILKLFQEGFYNEDRRTKKQVHETYKHIVVAVAPGGMVVIFLTGLWHRVEIGRYQAKETFVSVNEFYDNPSGDNQQQFFDWWFENGVPKDNLSKIKKDGIPFGLWDTYRERYNWRFDVQFYKQGDKEIAPRDISYINGEEDILKPGEDVQFLNQALPKVGRLYFKTNYCEATFDEDEIVAAFKKVTQGNAKAEVTIVAKVQFMYKSVKFSVKCGDNVVELEKVNPKMWANLDENGN
jgi:Protein of unknown function (DUF2931)